MGIKQQMTTNTDPRSKTSALDRFNLSFEYNKTLQEIKREVRTRTM